MSLTRMEYKILTERRDLSGDEMLPHWAYKNFGLLGDSIIAFCGLFDVPPEKWIDLESLMHGHRLPKQEMLHFIVEHFDTGLKDIMYRQYVLLSVLEEKLMHRIKMDGCRLVRLGDDLYEGESRLSITAAGKTLVSAKIHLGVFLEKNESEKCHGLKDYGIEPLELAEVVINQYRAEMRRLSEKSWRSKPIV